MFSSNQSNVVTAANYIEDVFSTYLYTGTGAALTITNNIDLSTKGGLTWIKGRSGATGHRLTDTARGVTKSLESNSSAGEATESTGLTAFGTTGFTIGADADYNTSADTYVSWTFRKQPKFFDIQTWTGNGSAQTLSHALGSVPGCIIVKNLNTAQNWQVYHKDVGNTKALQLNGTAAASAANAIFWNNTTPTSTQFTVGTANSSTGDPYVAYIFAHDAGGFGLADTDNVISCGSFTTDGAGAATVTLGYEPQWVMTKSSSGTSAWRMFDTMRGLTVAGQNDALLQAQSSAAEITNSDYCSPTATGFTINGHAGSETHIYIAIRRGPMKVPTDATKVFAPIAYAGNGGASRTITGAGFPPDLSITKSRNATNKHVWFDRLRGVFRFIQSNSDSDEVNDTSTLSSFNMNGISIANTGETSFDMNFSGTDYIDWMMGRAPSFMDVVCYTGTGSATTFSHNLGVVPELIIVKRRDTTGAWDSYSSALANTEYVVLNTTAAKATGATRWNSTTPTSSVFSVGTSTTTNASAGTYVAYLFATCAGVSKVGSYTGNATLTTINCGFTGGARFVLIKRTDTTGAWYVWDTARGMTSGTDASLRLNTANVESNDDSVYTASTGFQLLASPAVDVNTSSGTYIFLAIA